MRGIKDFLHIFADTLSGSCYNSKKEEERKHKGELIVN